MRSGRPELFCKRVVLRNFAKLTGKHLCQSLFFNKVSGLRPVPEACNFIKNETMQQVFSCEFFEISKNSFSYRSDPVAASAKWINYFRFTLKNFYFIRRVHSLIFLCHYNFSLGLEKNIFLLFSIFRSSHLEMFLVKGFLKTCSKFIGEQPCRSVISIKFFNKVYFSIKFAKLRAFAPSCLTCLCALRALIFTRLNYRLARLICYLRFFASYSLVM